MKNADFSCAFMFDLYDKILNSDLKAVLNIPGLAGNISLGASFDEVGGLDFEDIGEKRMNIGHTFVDESLRGHGVGAILVGKAVQLIKDKGYTVHVTCSYAKKCIQENNWN